MSKSALSSLVVVLAGAALASCASSERPGGNASPDASTDAVTFGPNCVDRDGDGYRAAAPDCPAGTDCDDSDPSIHPGIDEICGNGIDEDCSGEDEVCPGTCRDRDRDGYGEGEGCRGRDCDDQNPDIHENAQEICGDGIDQNCDGEDRNCSAQCTDEDDDGFGAPNANRACVKEGADCDDSDPDIHPAATEICDGIDNDCDGTIDECPGEAECTSVGGEQKCRLALGDSCSDSTLCPEGTRCDPNSRECRKGTNATCSTGECLEVLSCKDGVCKGEFCQNTECSDSKPRCDDRQSRCVECRYWQETDDPNCGSDETCIAKGWCGRRVSLTNTTAVSPYTNVTEALLELSVTLADCWKDKFDGPSPDMCAGLETGSAIATITESDIRDAYDEYKEAYENDNLQSMSAEQYNQLGKLLGDGLFDLNNLAWKSDVPPDSKEVCVWYDDHGTFGRAKLHVQECSRFDL